MIDYISQKIYKADKNTTVGTINISDYVEKDSFSAKSAWINVGGWQSWNPGFEIKPDCEQEKLTCHIIKPFNKYLIFPETEYKTSKHTVLGQFIIYLRWDDYYLVLASLGNINNTLPPVQFIVHRDKNTIDIEICDKGKTWSKEELQAQIEIFTANNFFEAQDKLEKPFGSSDKNSINYSKRFEQAEYLGNPVIGWESWYNHYANINEKIIEEDLKALKTTKNLITMSEKTDNIIFQIDDGWEKQLGNWDINKKKFPKGLKYLSQEISKQNYIPGLWIAPFIIDLRTPIANEHPNWLLRDFNGHLISVGFNPLWGANGSFYVLDLSNDEVIEYLDSIMNTIINEWGFRFIKLDFLYAGMIYGNYKTPDASFKWYSKAINVLTSRKTNNQGEKITYLGCGAPFELSFKQLPLCRIGCDTYEHWENKLSKALRINGRNSAYLNLKDTIGHALWNKSVFLNDPDVIFIRTDNCSLSYNEKLLIATVNLLFGSQIMYSDDPAKSTSEKEQKLAQEILLIQKRYSVEKFSVKNIDKDKFFIESFSKKFNGIINLGKNPFIKINEV